MPQICPACHEPISNLGAHMERCTGRSNSPFPLQELDDSPGPGINVFWPVEQLWRHLRKREG